MDLIEIGFLLIFIGIIVLLVGMMYEASKSSSSKDRERTQVGGVIFIGPIPIIFGSSKNIAKWMIIAAIILFILMIVFFYIL
ncbi:MAG: TIGR00304 family protein [Sulfolobaceae archaeon]